MKKFLLPVLLAVVLLQIPVDCNAIPKPDKVKKYVIGTWKYHGILSAPINNTTFERKSLSTDNPEILYKAYTFREDGKCVIWSLDKSKFDFPTQTVSYTVTTRKDKNGLEYAAIAFAENDVAPEDIEKKLIGTYYCVVVSNKSSLCWVKTDRIDKFWGDKDEFQFSREQ